MPLGTLDRTPPPFFRQGPSAFTRMMFFSALAVFLMVADTRFAMTYWLRAGAATVLHPLQRALIVPVEALATSGEYVEGLHAARESQAKALQQLAIQSERSIRVTELERENAYLRTLLDLRPRLTVTSQTAEVLYEAADPYTRKVVLDKGSSQGVALGSPVVDSIGVVGQVTRVYPLSAEVTLLNDKDSAIPILNTRTQQRGVAFGHPGEGGMELRFMAGNADVQVGDILNTSGLDGVYPPGLPVAKVLRVDRRMDSAFAKIILAPMAGPDSARHVLVLQPLGTLLPPRADAAALAPAGAASGATAASAAHSASGPANPNRSSAGSRTAGARR